MTEATDAPNPGWDRMERRCGRCGHVFTATSQEEYVKFLREHTGAACLAVLGRMDSDHVHYLINDITRLMDRHNSVQQLVMVLEMLASHKKALEDGAR